MNFKDLRNFLLTYNIEKADLMRQQYQKAPSKNSLKKMVSNQPSTKINQTSQDNLQEESQSEPMPVGSQQTLEKFPSKGKISKELEKSQYKSEGSKIQ